MGNSASKGAAQTVGKAAVSRAAGAGKRQYPSSPSPLVNSAAAVPSTSTPAQPQPQQPQSLNQSSSSSDQTDTTSFVDLDARDPHFAASLSRIGPVQRRRQQQQQQQQQQRTAAEDYSPPTGLHVFPTTTKTSSSTAAAAASINPAIAIVNARDRIARKFEQESEDFDDINSSGSNGSSSGGGGRTLLSASEIRDVLGARERLQTQKQQQQGQGQVADNVIEKRFRLGRGVITQIISGGAVKNV